METKETPNITALKSFEVQKYDDPSAVATVFPLNTDLSDQDLARIAEICDQQLIYDLLFAERLEGKRYTKEDAKGFNEFGKSGWESDEYFVFLVRNNEGNIIGAVDIKSATLEDAEIGYWMDKDSPGYMTNVVVGLVDMAKEAGYKSLIGLTKEKNDSSKRVLQRAGFVYVGKDDKEEGNIYDKFRIEL